MQTKISGNVRGGSKSSVSLKESWPESHVSHRVEGSRQRERMALLSCRMHQPHKRGETTAMNIKFVFSVMSPPNNVECFWCQT